MIASRLHRLRTMSREEWSFRVRGVARTGSQRLATTAQPPRWHRRDIRRALAGFALGGEMERAITRGAWQEVHHRLAVLLRERPSRFVLDPSSRQALRRDIIRCFPTAPGDAAQRADRILAGTYDLLGYEALEFRHGPSAVDWHFDPVHGHAAPRVFWADVPYLDPSCGDHKIIWELNRHQHWLVLGRALWLTGDEAYAEAIVSQLGSWLPANPPRMGINWASMLELSFRSLSWVWATHALLGHGDAVDRGPWLVDLLLALDRQLTHIEQNLSYYFSPNTHLTGEVLALYVAGTAFPELARSARWTDLGRRVLLHEIRRQIGGDGGHVERSTHYHRYTLDFYLLALLTAQRTGDVEAAAAFGDAAGRLAGFMRTMADDRGWLPSIGDDDGGMLWPITGRDPKDVRDSLATAAEVLDRPALAPWGATEEAFWLTTGARDLAVPAASRHRPARATAPARLQTHVLTDTGYIVMRDTGSEHCVFDAGEHGYLNGGHAHADALALTLGVDNHPLLIDPGTVTYTADPRLRDRMRRTAAHNTLTVDDRSSSVPAGPFQWRSRADGRVDALRCNARFAWVEGAHDGFAPAGHRRSIVHATGDGWLILDEVAGGEPHVVRAHWHFNPAWHVTCDGNNRLHATDDRGRTAWLLHDGGALWLVHGDEESGLGWYSPRYGAIVPTWTARITRRGDAPVSIATWVGSGKASGSSPSLERIATDADSAGPATAVQVAHGDRLTITMLRPGDLPVRAARSCSVAVYHTDARLLHYSTAADRLTALAVADASHVLALRDGLLTIDAEARVDDLHLAIEGDRLDLRSSAPPARLQIRGSALHGLGIVRLNGREIPASRRAGPDDALAFLSTDWAEPDAAQLAGPWSRDEAEHQARGEQVDA